MVGGAGNDLYEMSTAATRSPSWRAAARTRARRPSAASPSAANVENLTLPGSADISGTGNDVSNRLTGNAGKNTLTGGKGNDTLDGGADARQP